jgi:hypothetical protein
MELIMNTLAVLLLCAIAPTDMNRARAVVAVVEARIDAAQGPALPDTGHKRKAPASELPPMRMELGDASESTALGRYVVTAYTGPNCKILCKQARDVWGDGDERVAVIWSDEPLPGWIKAKLPKDYKYPVLVWQVADGSYSWPKLWSIYRLDAIAKMCHTTHATRESVAGAGPVAGVIHAGPQIERMLNWWRTSIGEGIEARADWDASRDKPSISLIRLGEWEKEAIYGHSGEFRLSAVGAINLPTTDASLRYRFVEGRLRLYGETELDAGFLDINKPASSVESIGDGQPVGFGPGTILTVFSLLHGIWQIMNPECDVILPGRVTCTAVLTGDNLAVKFERAPSVKVVAWWTVNLGVSAVDISPQRIKISLTGSRWFKSKTFQVGGATEFAPEPVEALPVMADEPEPKLIVGTHPLTTGQLKEFASRYRGPSVSVVGGDFRRHLTDGNHGFAWAQVMGLTQHEAERVHSGHHNRALTTTSIVTY